MTGAMTVVVPQKTYTVGDVIMFESRQAKVPTTHRIAEVIEENGRTQFVTKGDANEEADNGLVTTGQVMGKVIFDVPRVGFVLDFARQPMGFLMLIVLPALLIVLGEVDKIWREIKARRRKEDDDEYGGSITGGGQTVQVTEGVRPMMDISTPVRFRALPTLDLRGMTPYRKTIPTRQWQRFSRHAATTVAVVFSVLVWSSGFLGTTVSYFNDVETSTDNLLNAIALDVAVTPAVGLFNHIGGQFDEDTIVITAAPETDSVEVKYDIVTNILSSTTTLCDVIEADASSPVVYTGPLATLAGSDASLDVPWSIAFSLASTSALGAVETCQAEIELTAWHFDEDSGEGYFDEEVVPLMFTYAAPITGTAAVLGATFQLPSTVQEIAEKAGVGELVEGLFGGGDEPKEEVELLGDEPVDEGADEEVEEEVGDEDKETEVVESEEKDVEAGEDVAEDEEIAEADASEEIGEEDVDEDEETEGSEIEEITEEIVEEVEEEIEDETPEEEVEEITETVTEAEGE